MGRVVSTTQVPTACSKRVLNTPVNVLVLADPRRDLEASYREGVEIRTLLDQANERFAIDFKSAPVDIAFVKKHLRDYDIVHYAGHADYDPQNPSDGGWLLTDGRLKAGEISAMGGLQPMPFLVFSNACQSGRSGEWRVDETYEQQIFGLANAYLMAGVQHYIGTFWEILDEPSLHFSRQFYCSLACGEAVGEAIRKAREALIGEFGEETIVWASYMLYGDPTFTFAAGPALALPIGRVEDQSGREWNQATRGKTVAGERAAYHRYSGWMLCGLTAFLAVAVWAYVALYGKFANQTTKVATPFETALDAVADVRPKAAAPLTLTMNIIGQRQESDGSYSEIIVREGSLLRSRDHFQVHLETNRPSHVYVLLFDSQGRATQLFPDPKIEQPGFFEAGRRMAIPDKDLWFWLDEHPGTETVYVLASEESLQDIRGLLKQMATASEAEQIQLSKNIKQRIGIVERGVGGIAKGKIVSYALSDGKTIQKVTDVVTGSGAVVRAVSFEHR
jgi:hypothetical protein